jgi:hypothetical protein
MCKVEYMFKATVILIIMMLIGGVSCSHHSHSHSKSSTELTLNNGKKWKSDKHTMDRIIEMKKTVVNSKMMSNTALKNSLDLELSSLIQGCIMKGKDHDALHVFLEKLMPLIEKLKDTDVESSKHVRKKIKNLLNLYSDYFEL